jgi:Kazal-type serine protease inhibitor domain
MIRAPRPSNTFPSLLMSLLAHAPLGLCACATEVEVLAVDERTSDSSGSACTRNEDCPAGWFCRRTSCNARAGSCRPRPIVCSANAEPVCGCDRVTYLNPCLLETKGQSLAARGECPDPLACALAKPPGEAGCPEGSICGSLTSGRGCERESRGACWVIPLACDPREERGGSRFVPCGRGVPEACISACTALRSGVPHRVADRCL